MSNVWMITDENGYEITTGLQGPEVSDEAAKTAQSIADRRQQPVWLGRADGTGADTVFEPEF